LTIACILVGTFLLAIPILIGVENAVRWLLHWRERLFRLQRYLTLAEKEVIFGTPDIRDLKQEYEGKAVIFHPFRPQYLLTSMILFGLLVWHVINRNSNFIKGHFECIIEGLIPKLEDPDSCYVRRHWDIHCKNVRRSNGIWAPCSGADDVADESMSPQFGITIARGTIGEHLGIWRYPIYPFIGALGLLLIGVAYVFLFIPFFTGFLFFQMFFWLLIFSAEYTIVVMVTVVLFTIPLKFFGWFANTNQERKLSWLGFLLLFVGSIFQVFVIFSGGH
jgi:hypothetical protein